MPDINFLNIDDCSNISINTDEVFIIQQMSGVLLADYTNISKYEVTWSNNCCDPITVDYAPKYLFAFQIEDCRLDNLLGTDIVIYTTNILGINYNLVSTVTYRAVGDPSFSNLVVTDNNGLAQVEIIIPQAAASQDYEMLVTTTEGFVYTLEFTIFQDPLDPCATVIITPATITYPTDPTEIEFLNSGTELNFNTLVQNTPVHSGVYQVIICEVQLESKTCYQNHVFIDCGDLQCQVVNELAQCVESNIFDLYNALLFSNDCTLTTSYEKICALYELMLIKLEHDSCYDLDDECNCTDAIKKANRTFTRTNTHTTYSTKSKGGCGCG